MPGHSLHLAVPKVLVKVPILHLLHQPPSVGLSCPGLQGAHDFWPSDQSPVPAGQARQFMVPVVFVKVPILQLLHQPPSVGLSCPGLQGAHDFWPSDQSPVPAGQGLQSDPALEA